MSIGMLVILTASQWGARIGLKFLHPELTVPKEKFFWWQGSPPIIERAADTAPYTRHVVASTPPRDGLYR